MERQGNFRPLLATATVATGAVCLARALIRRQRRIRFEGRVVVITGGSRGFGLVLARRFGREGAKLVICSRDQDELERAAGELYGRGIVVKPVHCDVRVSND